MEYILKKNSFFLGRQVSIPLAAYVAVIHLSNLLKNIFICVPKTNKGLMGLIQHWGELLILFIFG